MHDENLLQIIEGCRQGRPASEKALFQCFAPKVLAIARRYATDEPQALDFLQEAFLVLFKKIELFDPQKGPFEGWLYRLSVNTILQIMRKNRNSEPWVELPPELPENEIEDPDLELLQQEQLMQAIRQLPEGYRQVLNLFVFEDWSHRDIAAALQITESASRSQLTRAKQLLKQKLQPILQQYEQGLV
ncbi:MAG: sigma-70 family RNA polymerase sigma factor [Lewinellaceae bacterium]|nr:sigma-70 family RNA polymerase sigma factor [Lewinellaceae bacterium]